MQETEVTVRFCETDALGHINNTSYFIYLEEARIKFFESLGYSMRLKDWNFILASAKCDFMNQGYFNQILSIKTYVSKIGTKSFQIEHEITCSQTRELIAKGTAVVVFFDFEKQQSEVLPDLLKEALKNNLIHS
ncbi:acyl-CoA thioester hydrolase [Peribacillus deserti]|uniref:Acyl-CoA thioester hydrolase n=1 Tax=Peribacillus deserti TaxID=673318 RepID=A0ABS2QDT6_9BACI|nr:acyl-CoA thioesterase [Peribacillus deserti]MBM7691326.1 acyl-CoA thioester hydrolase [Peribacillus deserti]